VSQLKSYHADYAPKFTIMKLPPQLDLMDLEPEEVLDECLSKKGNTVVPQILVKWTGVPAEMETWHYRKKAFVHQHFYVPQGRCS
jgi:hypothetical protein